jgi:hypothetical protein
MKKTDSFLEERIRWKAKSHNFPTEKTIYWEDRPNEFKAEISSDLGTPVLLSIKNETNYIVICTRGSLVLTESISKEVLYSEVESIKDYPLEPDEEKVDLKCVLFKLNDETEVPFYPEPFEAAFSVWNILIMLKRMS